MCNVNGSSGYNMGNKHAVCDRSWYDNIWLVIWLEMRSLFLKIFGCSSNAANETLNIMAIINCANLFLLNKTNTY